jgi:hypothetical protein
MYRYFIPISFEVLAESSHSRPPIITFEYGVILDKIIFESILYEVGLRKIEIPL